MTATGPEQSNMNNGQLMDIVEKVSVGGAICGAIASLAFKQFVLASAVIPVSVCLSLNLVNRKRLLDANTQQLNTINQQIDAINQQNNQTAFAEMTQAAIAQLTQENAIIQGAVETVSGQLAEVRQLNTNLRQDLSSAISSSVQLAQENAGSQAKLETLSGQLAEVQRLTNNFSQDASDLKQSTQSLSKEQTIIHTRVNWLQDIEKYTNAIRTNPYDADSYYNRGALYKYLGYKEAAIWDHTEAIRINPKYAKAYQERGVICAELGDKKRAVEDLREATKLFFEQGDIASYQTARDLSKQLHDHTSQSKTDPTEEVVVASLFT